MKSGSDAILAFRNTKEEVAVKTVNNTRRQSTASNRQKAPNLLQVEVEKDLTTLKNALMASKQQKAQLNKENETITNEDMLEIESSIKGFKTNRDIGQVMKKFKSLSNTFDKSQIDWMFQQPGVKYQ